MKKVVINTHEVIADFKARIGDAAIMEKYSLSARSLINLKKELLGRGLISPDDVRPSRTPPKSNRKPLKAKEFVADFRDRPDDAFLMQKYGLSPSELRTVYRKLIEKRWISEYEFYMREGIVPEVGEPIENLSMFSNAAVLLHTTTTAVPTTVVQSRESGLPEDFYRDHSGIKIGPGMKAVDLAPDDESEPTLRAIRNLRDDMTVVQLMTTELCPNCSRPKGDTSEESCQFCGIVYAKLQKPSQKGPVIWEEKNREKG
jgi:hypothetical protein